MRLAKGIIWGAWFLVGINLLMAFGAIGIFTRMSPAIATILKRNGDSLKACEKMLASIALSSQGESLPQSQKDFRLALEKAEKNITEVEEPFVLKQIRKAYEKAVSGDWKSIVITVKSIVELGKINRRAMEIADNNAQQLGSAGAWSIVFMSICAFLVGVIFIKHLSQKLLIPLEEIKTVLLVHQDGDINRRCVGQNLSPDVEVIYMKLNKLLDQTIKVDLTKR